jgi:hypothetical protein
MIQTNTKPTAMDALNARLLAACFEGQTGEASGLLDQGAEIETRHEANQGTSLQYSAGGGYVGTMKMLLDRGANIEAKAINNYTPLHISAQEGQVHAVRPSFGPGGDHRCEGRSPIHSITHSV